MQRIQELKKTMAEERQQKEEMIQKLTEKNHGLLAQKQQDDDRILKLTIEIKDLRQALDNALNDKFELEQENQTLQQNLDEVLNESKLLKNQLINPNKVLLEAAQEGEIKKAKNALDFLGANLETVDADGRTPLMIGLLGGYNDFAEFLLGKGAKLSLIYQQKPIWDVLCDAGQFDTATYLLDKFPKDDPEGTDLINFYQSAGNPDLKQYIANMLLFQASKQGNQDLAEKALSLGANINAQQKAYLETALHKAVYSGQVEMVKFLLNKGSSTTIQDKNSQVPFEVTSDKEIQKVILDFQNQQAAKIQAHVRGFFARNDYKHELKQLSGPIITKLLEAEKYAEVNKLITALKENRFSEALKMINLNKEPEVNAIVKHKM